jgi:hypothetical protein
MLYFIKSGDDCMFYESIGIFYAAFLFLGVGIGLLVGFINEHLIFGGIIGIILGIGLGLLSHGTIALKEDKC